MDHQRMDLTQIVIHGFNGVQSELSKNHASGSHPATLEKTRHRRKHGMPAVAKGYDVALVRPKPGGARSGLVDLFIVASWGLLEAKNRKAYERQFEFWTILVLNAFTTLCLTQRTSRPLLGRARSRTVLIGLLQCAVQSNAAHLNSLSF